MRTRLTPSRIPPTTTKPPAVPAYRLQKRKSGGNLAFVEIRGKRNYLGAYGSTESRQQYNRLVAEFLTNNGREAVPADDISIVEVAERYLAHCKTYYLKHGMLTAEPSNVALATRSVLKLFGRTKAAQFGPKSLKLVQQEMVRSGDTRKYINRHVGRIKRMFKWAVAEELLPPSVHHGLQAVPGLKYGRSDAKEAPPVKPVPIELVEPVKKVVSRQVAALIDLQLLTGARPTELLIMRGKDIDTSGPIWAYNVSSHKTEHHGHLRIIPLGPKAQAVIEPFLKNRAPDAYLFSPLEAEAERYEALRAKLKGCEKPVPGEKAKILDRSTRLFGDRYDRTSYARAIARGCEVALPPPEPLRRLRIKTRNGFRWEKEAEWKARLGEKQWQQLKAWTKEHHWHPYRIRHSFGTDVRKHFGLEVAQILLGHAKADVTQIYAERDMQRAFEIAAKIG